MQQVIDYRFKARTEVFCFIFCTGSNYHKGRDKTRNGNISDKEYLFSRLSYLDRFILPAE